MCSPCPKLRIAVIFVKTQTFVRCAIRTWALSRSRQACYHYTTATLRLPRSFTATLGIVMYIRIASNMSHSYTENRHLFYDKINFFFRFISTKMCNGIFSNKTHICQMIPYSTRLPWVGEFLRGFYEDYPRPLLGYENIIGRVVLFHKCL